MVSVEVLQTVLVETALDFCPRPGSQQAEVDWTKVVDPVQPFIASLTRIGWRAVTAIEVEDHNNCRWSFLTLCPEAIARMAAQAAARWSDLNAFQKQFGSNSAAWAAPIHWDPLRRLKLEPRRRNAPRSLLCGPSWSQWRLHKKGLALSGACQACGDHQGSLWHRFFDCPALAEVRHQHLHPLVKRCARQIRTTNADLAEQFSRGLLPVPECLAQPPLWDAEVVWWQRPATSVLQGLLFTDGSSLYPTEPHLRRAGWSIVMLSAAGELEAAAYGACPRARCPQQTIGEAEDYAAYMLRECALPPFVVRPDCLTTVRAINGEGVQQKRSNKARAHLWSAFSAIFEGAGVSAAHTKAHATEADVANEKSTWWERKANAEADRLAKLGAALHGLKAQEVNEFRALAWLTAELGRFLSAMAAFYADQGVADCVSLESLEKPPAQDNTGPEASELEVGSFQGPRVVPPAAADRLPASFAFLEHRLLTATTQDDGAVQEQVVSCTRCGAYCSVGRARPEAIPRSCVGRGGGAGLQHQRRKFSKGIYPRHGSQRHLESPRQLSAWQAIALQHFVAVAAASSPSERSTAAHTADAASRSSALDRASLLKAFGLDEASFRDVLQVSLLEAANPACVD